jgi:hypothetical protein
LSERNRQLDMANQFANLCNAQGDNKHMQQYMTKLLQGTE